MGLTDDECNQYALDVRISVISLDSWILIGELLRGLYKGILPDLPSSIKKLFLTTVLVYNLCIDEI